MEITNKVKRILILNGMPEEIADKTILRICEENKYVQSRN